MVLFICNLPFQILNAVNIASNLFDENQCDIYITDNHTECIEIYKKLKATNIFKNVYLIKIKNRYFHKTNRKMFKSLISLYNVITYKDVVKYIPNLEASYDEIFIAGPDLPPQLIYYYFKSKNNNTILSLFEEGVYQYYVLGKKTSVIREKISQRIFGYYYLYDCKKVYTYRPDLVDTSLISAERIKIPYIEKNYCTKEMYNLLMGYKPQEDKLFEKKFIFLGGGFINKEENDYQDRLITKIEDIVGKNNISIKLHPKSEEQYFHDKQNLIKCKTPLELIALNKNFSDKVIISIVSSASLNFKLIFREEPYVIMLYKLFHVKNKRLDIYNFIEKVKKQYSSDKFFIPENENDLVNIINQINRQC